MDTKSVKEDIRKAEAAIDPNQTREVPGAYDQAEREADEAEHERIISDMRGENENMIPIAVYKDTTGLYTQEEIDEDNIAELYFPVSIVKDFVAAGGFSDDFTFFATYTADNTFGLVDFARERGFEVSRGESELSFAEQVDKSLAGELPFYTSLKVCDTPDILLKVGCEQLPMLYTQSHLRKAIQPKSENEHTHGLSVEQVKDLPNLLKEPVIVADSLNRSDSIIVVTSEFDTDDNPILASIKPNGKGRYEIEEIESNFITSFYGRNNFPVFFERLKENDNLLFCDKNKTQELFERWGEQYSELTNSLVYDSIIHQSRNISRENQDISADISQNMPDPSVTLEDMQEYGYSYENMLPLGTDRAKELFSEAEIFHLYPDGSEGVVDNIEEFDNATAGTMWGIEKDSWEIVQNRDREGIDKAKGFISDYLYSEFGNDNPNFNDLTSIGLAYTTIDNADFLKEAGVTDYEKEFEIQVDANLIDKEVITYIDGEELFSEKFDSMELMNSFLETLDFDELISIGDAGWQKIADREIDREAAAALDAHEAEFGADGSRVFPRLNETKEETLAGQIDRFMSLSMPEYDYAIDRQNNIKQLTSFLENGHYDEVKRIFNDVIRHGNAETSELEEMALNLSAQVNDLEKGKEHTLPLPEQNIQEELDAIFDNSKGVRQGRGREPQADAGSPKERLDSADKINAAELTGDYDRMVSYLATGKIKEPKITLTKTAEQDRITASASSKNVSEPFNAKDGNKYVRIMIPNKDRHDDSPWASIVVKPEQVSDAGKGIKSIDFRANGTVTVYKGNRQPDGSFINAKFKLSTTEVKEWLDKTAPKNIMKDIPVKKEKSKELKEQHKQEQNKTKSADKNRTGDGIE